MNLLLLNGYGCGNTYVYEDGGGYGEGWCGGGGYGDGDAYGYGYVDDDGERYEHDEPEAVA